MPALLQADAALHDASIGKDGGRGEITRTIAGEERDHACNLAGTCHAPQRYGRVQGGELGGIVHRAQIDRRVHRARADPDHEDIVLCELEACSAREHAHTALGEAVCRVAGHRPVLVHRGDVDDAAAATLLDHLLGCDLRSKEGALEVYAHDRLVLRFGRVENRGACFDPSIVHHYVHAAEPAHGGIDELLQVGKLAHIGCHADRLAAELGNLLLDGTRRLGMCHVIDHDACTVLCKFEHNRLTDPAVAAGDDRNLVLQRHDMTSRDLSRIAARLTHGRPALFACQVCRGCREAALCSALGAAWVFSLAPSCSIRLAINPVQPVWWDAPQPRPLSPWKYSWNRM